MTRTKRAFDVVGAGFALIFLSPLLLAIAVIVRVVDGSPVIFRQERVGRYGGKFNILKFRTMLVAAESAGGQVTRAGDPRITSVGRVLRRTKLDELPQLLNVLRGEMSLVGPRPEVRRYVEYYTGKERKVLDLVPGITDPASIAFRHEERLLASSADPVREYIRSVLPEKIRLNLEYASRRSLGRDIVVLLLTLKSLWSRGP